MADRPAPLKEIKLAVLNGVREHSEHEPVELWLNRGGRVVVRAYNECGNNHTDVDLRDLLGWAQSGTAEGLFGYVGEGFPALSVVKRDQ